MKIRDIINRFAILALFITLSCGTTAQKKVQKNDQVRQLLESKVFVFIPQSATPSSGGMIQLTSDYYLKISNDTLKSYLPYFGVAYQARFGSTNSPLDFSSTDFEYSLKVLKNGTYDINIRLNNPNDPNQLILSVSTSGYANLRVISMNRQPISFYGEVAKPRAPRKK